MSLEAVRQLLEAWEIPLESSWRCLDAREASSGGRLGGSTASSGELLEASRKLPEPTLSPLESLRRFLGALGTVLEASWQLSGLSWRRLGGSTGRHGAFLVALGAMLEPYGELPMPFWTCPDGSGQRLADLLNIIVILIDFRCFFD